MDSLLLIGGALLGALCGFIPGLHSNSVAFVLMAIVPLNPSIAIALLALGTAQATTTVLANMFGAARENDIAPVAQRFFENGRARDAIGLHGTGALLGFLLALAIGSVLEQLLLRTRDLHAVLIPVVLIAAVASTMLRMKTNATRARAALVFMASAVVGLLFLKPGAFSEPLLVLLTGFFALSGLIGALLLPANLRSIQPKNEKPVSIHALAQSITGTMAGTLVATIPSITAHQSLALAQAAGTRIKKHAYLVATGALETSSVWLALIVWHALGATRTGLAVQIAQTHIAWSRAPELALAGLAGIGTGLWLNHATLQLLVQHAEKIPWKLLYLALLTGLATWCLTLSPLNLVPLLGATGIGLLCEGWNVPKTACMAFLTVPTLLYYL